MKVKLLVRILVVMIWLVNITKTKKMSNVRSSGADDKAKIVPAIKFSLEEALEYIQKDEYVEVTPNTYACVKFILTEVSVNEIRLLKSKL